MDDPDVTIRHRLGFAVGRAVDKWCVRGYSFGTFRNGFANGYQDRLHRARTVPVYDTR